MQARNAIRFAEDMKLLPNVTVPGVYLSYTSRKVRASLIGYFLRFRHYCGVASCACNGGCFAMVMLNMWLIVQVLVSAWIEGEKLSETKAADLLPLIRTALNCYLMQLLESGFLHADPHPGNLLRTPDGRLCVLDFGLMTEVRQSCPEFS